MPGNWVVGGLVQQSWSFAGPSDEGDVNKTSLQYFLNYNFGDGWYLTSSPTFTANWEADSGQRWTAPLGGGLGKLHKFGNQPVDFKFQSFYNVEAPDGAADWSVQFTVKFLFPKGGAESGPKKTENRRRQRSRFSVGSRRMLGAGTA